MTRGARIAIIVGAIVISALSGPRSASDLWNGLRGPYVEPPVTRVAAELEREEALEPEQAPR